MLRSCSPIFLFLALVTVFMLPLGITYWGFTRDRHESLDDFDRNTWLLISLFIAAIVSIALFIIYFFFPTVGC